MIGAKNMKNKETLLRTMTAGGKVYLDAKMKKKVILHKGCAAHEPCVSYRSRTAAVRYNGIQKMEHRGLRSGRGGKMRQLRGSVPIFCGSNFTTTMHCCYWCGCSFLQPTREFCTAKPTPKHHECPTNPRRCRLTYSTHGCIMCIVNLERSGLGEGSLQRRCRSRW